MYKYYLSKVHFSLRLKLVKSEGYARMEKNILAEIETFRGTEPEADIGEALRQLVKEVMRRSKQVRLYVFAFSFIWEKPFLRFFFYFVLQCRVTDPENQDL